jgi:nephrocystin-3
VNPRTLRIFLSSTFRDFGEERDLLVKRVFPALRARLRDRFVELVDIDLRWGITVEEAERGEVLPICLAEIDRSRPYFIGMLGERYGWIPPPEGYAPDLLERQPWLKSHQGGKSVTELEILHGVLNNRRMRGKAFFYFRSSAYARTKGGDYLPSPEDRARQSELKRRIRERGLPVVSYANPEALAKRIERDLWKLLDAEFPASSVPDAFEREVMRHEAYAFPRRRLYLGGERYQAALQKLLDVEEPRIVIEGASGGGKSALLANFFDAYRKRHRRHLVHEHYLGASADAADPHALVRRLIEFIHRATGSTEEIPGDPQKLMDSLPLWLATASAWGRRRKTRFIFVLDSFNSLTNQQDLRWWPAFLPRGITMVVSCLPGPVHDALKGKTEALPGQDKPPKWKAITVRPLTKPQSATLLNTYLARFNKKLAPQMVKQVQRHPLATNPLFLRTLAEELRLFGVHEELQKRLDHYLASETIDDLFERVLERVEKDCGKKQVKAAMTAIWASRAGLSETEILGIAQLTPVAWATMRHMLDEALLETNGRIAFAHDYLRIAVRDRHLTTREKQAHAHRHIAQWFRQRPVDARRAEEEPYQLGQAEAWAALRRLVCDADSFSGIVKFCGTLELLAYWNLLQQAGWGGLANAYRHAWRRWKRDADAKALAEISRQLTSFLYQCGIFSAFVIEVAKTSIELSKKVYGDRHLQTGYRMSDLGLLLQETHRLEDALNWSRCALHVFEFSGSPPANVSKQISNIGRVLQAQGNLDEAGAAFRRALDATVQSSPSDNDESVAILHNNLAMLLHDQGDLSGARHHYERALEILRYVSGVTSPLFGIFSKNLGCLYQDLGDHKRAFSVLTGATRVLADTLGASHIECAYTESRIGITLYRLKRFDEAVSCFERAYKIVSAVFEPSHPEYISSLTNLQAARNKAKTA